MNLGSFVKAVVSRLTTLGVNHSEIFSSDIIHEFNTIAPQLRSQDVEMGNVSFYTIRETFDNFTNGLNNFMVAEFTNEPMQSLDADKVILTAFGHILKEEPTWPNSKSEGDRIRIGDSLYICTKDYSNLDTRNSVFTDRQVKHLHKHTNYKQGTVVFDQTTQTYYHATDSYYTDTIPSEWTIAYWRYIGSSSIMPFVLNFEDLRTSQVSAFTISFLKNLLYTTDDIEEVTVEFVPKWTHLNSEDAEIRLRPHLINVATDRVVSILQSRILNRVQDTDE